MRLPRAPALRWRAWQRDPGSQWARPATAPRDRAPARAPGPGVAARLRTGAAPDDSPAPPGPPAPTVAGLVQRARHVARRRWPAHNARFRPRTGAASLAAGTPARAEPRKNPR